MSNFIRKRKGNNTDTEQKKRDGHEKIYLDVINLFGINSGMWKE